ncbi:DUF192 domain-containing protein [Sphingomicrobium lutaoense]|nr:DUF192 domain-containing protein [Sphingomicrobium lutaoense]
MIALLLAALVSAPAAACRGPDDSSIPASPAGLDQTLVTITTGEGESHQFTAEIARTPAEQARGLMFRDELAPDRGMIFLYEVPQNASFWMKNTYIPLDMIFIRPDGTIANIAENTVPLQLEPYVSLEPVTAVFEIAGGRSAELGIKTGDRVSWR